MDDAVFCWRNFGLLLLEMKLLFLDMDALVDQRLFLIHGRFHGWIPRVGSRGERNQETPMFAVGSFGRSIALIVIFGYSLLMSNYISPLLMAYE